MDEGEVSEAGIRAGNSDGENEARRSIQAHDGQYGGPDRLVGTNRRRGGLIQTA